MVRHRPQLLPGQVCSGGPSQPPAAPQLRWLLSGGPRGQRPSRIPTGRYPEHHPNLGVSVTRSSKSEGIHIHRYLDETASSSTSEPSLPEEAPGEPGPGKDTGSRGQPPVEPHSAPKCPQLEIPEKRHISFPELFIKNRVQWRRRFLCPHARYPCPRTAKHHAPRSLRFPANLQAPLGDLSPRHPPNPRLQLPVPWSAGRSPAARLAVAKRRGPAAGRGQRTARGARLANLRRRSPRYVYLGRLTPALPAGSGRALARAPVGRPGWFGA